MEERSGYLREEQRNTDGRGVIPSRIRAQGGEQPAGRAWL